MKATLHHARVYAEWSLRRPVILAVAVVPILGAAALALGEIEQAVRPRVFVAALSTIGAAIAAMAGGPARGWDVGTREEAVLPTLPLRASWRTVAEIGPPLVLSILAAFLLRYAGGVLAPHLGADLQWLVAVHRLAPGAIVGAALLQIPGWVVGNRTKATGGPAGLGTMAVLVAASLPAAALLVSGATAWVVVSVPIAVCLYFAVPPLERRLLSAVDGLGRAGSVDSSSSRRPLHVDFRWQYRMGWRQMRPAAALVLGLEVLLVGWVLWVAPDQASTAPALGWLLLLQIPAGALSIPAFLPLGLSGKVSVAGRSRGSMHGELVQAWSVLPVEARTLRRAALRGAAVTLAGGLVGIALVIGGIATFAVMHDIEAPVGGLLRFGSWTAMIVFALTPLSTGWLLGDSVARRLAGAIVVLAPTLMLTCGLVDAVDQTVGLALAWWSLGLETALAAALVVRLWR